MSLEALLQQCTVKLTIPGQNGWGTGFFVAPGLLLTCAHVVRDAPNQQVEVFWPENRKIYPARVWGIPSDSRTFDVALLQIEEPIPNHPCVYLDGAKEPCLEDIQTSDVFFSYGYLKDYPNAAGVTADSEWFTGDSPPLIKFKGGKIQPGLSGGALLNLRTGKVCGIVKETHSSSFPDGGGAMPISVAYQQFLPLVNLLELQQKIHQQDGRWQKDLPVDQATAATARLFGVPYPRNHFFTGREALLENLHKQLCQNSTALINQVQVISGLGGIGKTQTAVEYAYRYYYGDSPAYDWVLWIKADTEKNLATEFSNLAIQLQLPETHLKAEERVKKWLADHNRWLLIFDNADNPEWLELFLPNNPQGRVLLTSRASVFDQVGVSQPFTLDALADDEAVNFLFRRVGRDRTASEEQAATNLATELGNLPLALEQAGAFILRRKISFQTYLPTYRKRRLEQLEQVKPQTGKYPASVLTTWSLNFQMVETASVASADLLRLSAVIGPDVIPYQLFAHGAAHLGEQLSKQLQIDDANEASMAVAALLEPLSQYSLIQWKPEQEQYSIHRLVQAVVRDGMSEEMQKLWATRAVNALEAAWKKSEEVDNWDLGIQLIPHIRHVVEIIILLRDFDLCHTDFPTLKVQMMQISRMQQAISERLDTLHKQAMNSIGQIK